MPWVALGLILFAGTAMPQPTAYERQYNFSNYQTQNPAEPLPGNQVDIELNSVKATLDETLSNLELIQRDDGQLGNNTVGLDQLKAEVEIGVNPPSAWATTTNYAVNDTVTKEAGFYRCLIAHVSGVFATDLAALKWELIVDFSAAISEAAIEDALHGAASKAEPVDGDEFMGNDSADSFTLRRFNWANIKATAIAAIGLLLNTTTGKTTPVDADNFLIGDSAASHANKKLSFANLKTAVFAGIGPTIEALTGKTTPVDADDLILSDSAAADVAKKLTWANLKAGVFAAFGPLVAGATGKTTPVDADNLLLADSAVSDATKKVSWSSVKATLKDYFDTLYVTLTASVTLSNKRITPRITTIVSSATPTPDGDASDQFTVTALAAVAAFAAPTGTPVDGQKLIIRIKDNGTARALTWNAIYRQVGTTLPTTTVLSKTLYVGFIYNFAETKWDCVAVSQEV